MPILSNVTPSPKPPDIFKGGTEPASAANTNFEGCLPVFPYNNATVTPSGHSFEMDDTPERERIRLNHRSNTFIEMHPNNSIGKWTAKHSRIKASLFSGRADWASESKFVERRFKKAGLENAISCMQMESI